MRELEAASSVTNEYRALGENVASSFYQLEDAVSEIRQALDQLEFQPDELNEIENRLAELSQLKRKYGKTIDDIIRYYEEIQIEIDQLENSEQSVGKLEEKSRRMEVENKRTSRSIN